MRGDFVTIAMQGDFGKPRPALVIQSDQFNGHATVTVLPVTNYASTICVKDEGGKALVSWKGGFYRGYPNNEPPAGQDDEAANAAVSGIYQAGLDALAERFGKAE